VHLRIILVSDQYEEHFFYFSDCALSYNSGKWPIWSTFFFYFSDCAPSYNSGKWQIWSTFIFFWLCTFV